MESVLLISSSPQARDALCAVLRDASYGAVTACDSAAKARRALPEGDYGILIINAPLTDEFGHELAMEAAAQRGMGVILLVKSEMAEDVAARVEDSGVFVLGKPLNRPLFYQALKLVAASSRRIQGLQRENTKLQSKIEEIRLVDRAKCTLIQVLSMTEPQAHRYIEKQAMDMRMTRRQIAESILKTYET